MEQEIKQMPAQLPTSKLDQPCQNVTLITATTTTTKSIKRGTQTHAAGAAADDADTLCFRLRRALQKLNR